jgi:hypothetical protein
MSCYRAVGEGAKTLLSFAKITKCSTCKFDSCFTHINTTLAKNFVKKERQKTNGVCISSNDVIFNMKYRQLYKFVKMKNNPK